MLLIVTPSTAPLHSVLLLLLCNSRPRYVVRFAAQQICSRELPAFDSQSHESGFHLADFGPPELGPWDLIRNNLSYSFSIRYKAILQWIGRCLHSMLAIYFVQQSAIRISMLGARHILSDV
jgi:hypothetical protein